MKVESISFPPLSSGILGFPISDCAKAFFEGVMEFLDKHIYTTLKKLNIVVIEKDKHKKFLDEWSKCYIARFKNFDDEPGSDEKSGEEVSNGSSDEEVKRPAPKKAVGKPSAILSSSSDDDNANKKPSAGIKKNTKVLSSSSDDDKPKKKAPVKNKYSDDSDSDSSKNKVGIGKIKIEIAANIYYNKIVLNKELFLFVLYFWKNILVVNPTLIYFYLKKS